MSKRKPKKPISRKAIAKRVRAFIDQCELDARTPETLRKFEEIVIAENGFQDGPDEVVVMGYFDPVEGNLLDDDGHPTETFIYDLTLENLGRELKKVKGLTVIQEANYVLDEATKKLVPV